VADDDLLQTRTISVKTATQKLKSLGLDTKTVARKFSAGELFGAAGGA